jgi:hypothetical protein
MVLEIMEVVVWWLVREEVIVHSGERKGVQWKGGAFRAVWHQDTAAAGLSPRGAVLELAPNLSGVDEGLVGGGVGEELGAVGVGRVVILKHTLPDGTHHFDWFCVPEQMEGGAEVRDVRTFRLAASVWPYLASFVCAGESGGVCAVFLPAEELPRHRRHYLSYEGDIGGGRGVVERVYP